MPANYIINKMTIHCSFCIAPDWFIDLKPGIMKNKVHSCAMNSHKVRLKKCKPSRHYFKADGRNKTLCSVPSMSVSLVYREKVPEINLPNTTQQPASATSNKKIIDLCCWRCLFPSALRKPNRKLNLQARPRCEQCIHPMR